MKLTGVLAPIPTPFDDSDRIDLARLRKALGQWLKSGLTGFVVLGSTGEAALLDDADASPVPVLLYNFTALTGVTLETDAVAELARHTNIIGMKESNSDVLRISD